MAYSGSSQARTRSSPALGPCRGDRRRHLPWTLAGIRDRQAIESISLVLQEDKVTGGPLHVSRKDAVLEVVLDRPKANAIDGPTSRKMGEVFARFRDDPELRVAIITAAGEKFFSA